MFSTRVKNVKERKWEVELSGLSDKGGVPEIVGLSGFGPERKMGKWGTRRREGKCEMFL